MMRPVSLAACFVLSTGPSHAGCAGQETACETETGTYHIEVPEGPGPFPAVVFLHGFGSRGESSVNVIRAAKDRGYAVIGPDGLPRGENRGRSWSFHPDWTKRRNETQFVKEVIADAVDKHGVDASRVLVGGFSIGGSLTSYLACEDPGLARAFAPLAGSFWRPHPDLTSCAGPVDVFHTHGWRDGTVPLEGRPLRNGQIKQGDVFFGMQIWRETNGCHGLKANEFDTEGDYWIRRWTECEAGSLTFVMHQGGHSIPKGWLTMSLDWFEELTQPPSE